MTKSRLNIAIAGSTTHTLICAQALKPNPNFNIVWILTPQPQPVGRKQTLAPNPMHQFALDHQLPVVLIQKKIDQTLQKQLEPLPTPDFLLVVDFGYIIPNWLLQTPKIAPVNIHPSALPAWRGSAPGQFVLLSGAKKSAISLIIMNDKLDQGPIIKQEAFTVEPNWTQTEYYDYSFKLMAKILAPTLTQYAQGQITAKTQSANSPTPIAKRLKKEDSFINWQILKTLNSKKLININLSDNLNFKKFNLPLINPQPAQIVRACYAFQPWPVLWTIIPTTKGPQRMKIYACHLKNNNQLVLDKVQIESKQQTTWNEIKNLILDLEVS